MAIASLKFQANQSQKIILVAMVTTVVVTIVEQIATGGLPAGSTTPLPPGIQGPVAKVSNVSNTDITSIVVKVALGGFIATSLLLLLSYVLPEFATGLAVVAAVGSVLTRGQPFWDAINSVVGTKPIATPALPLQNQINAEQPTGTYSYLPSNQG